MFFFSLCLVPFIYMPSLYCSLVFVFFFNDTPTTEIYTLSLHDALPISLKPSSISNHLPNCSFACSQRRNSLASCGFFEDRKSTRLNSSHRCISYAVFCLKKKNENNRPDFAEFEHYRLLACA